MPKPNYQFEKRRRELMKAKKKEEKRLRKVQKSEVGPEGGAGEVNAEAIAEPSDDPVAGDKR
jgi:hypothetical protein